MLSKIMMFQAKRTGAPHCYGSCYNSETHLRRLLETVKRYKANNDYYAALTTKNIASPILAVLR